MQSTFLVPGLTIVVKDNRVPGDTFEESFQHKGGISEYVEFLCPGERIGQVIRLAGTGHFHETVPVLDDKGHMTPQEVERDMAVDVALAWDAGYDTNVRSFVNIIATGKGGTHVTGFERSMVKTISFVARPGKFEELLRTLEANLRREIAVLEEDAQFEGDGRRYVLGVFAASDQAEPAPPAEATDAPDASG